MKCDMHRRIKTKKARHISLDIPSRIYIPPIVNISAHRASLFIFMAI